MSAPPAVRPTTPAPPRDGGELVVHVEAEPAILCDLVEHDAWSRWIVENQVVETLLFQDPWTGAITPRLAASFDATADALTLHLRPGVKWHDGQPFCAADVAFTIGRARDPAVGADQRSDFDPVSAVETPDANTVVLTLTRPAPFLKQALAHLVDPPRAPLQGQRPAPRRRLARAGRHRPLQVRLVAAGRRARPRAQPRLLGRKGAPRSHPLPLHPRQGGRLGALSARRDRPPVAGAGHALRRGAQRRGARRPSPPRLDAARLLLHRLEHRARPARRSARAPRADDADRSHALQHHRLRRPRARRSPAPTRRARRRTTRPSRPGRTIRPPRASSSTRRASRRMKLTFLYYGALALRRAARHVNEGGLRQGRHHARARQRSTSRCSSIGCAITPSTSRRCSGRSRVEQDNYQLFHSSQAAGGQNFGGWKSPAADALLDEIRQTADDDARHALDRKLHQLIHDEQPYTFISMREVETLHGAARARARAVAGRLHVRARVGRQVTRVSALARRLVVVPLTLVGITLVTFALVHALPGDAALVQAGAVARRLARVAGGDAPTVRARSPAAGAVRRLARALGAARLRRLAHRRPPGARQDRRRRCRRRWRWRSWPRRWRSASPCRSAPRSARRSPRAGRASRRPRSTSSTRCPSPPSRCWSLRAGAPWGARTLAGMLPAAACLALAETVQAGALPARRAPRRARRRLRHDRARQGPRRRRRRRARAAQRALADGDAARQRAARAASPPPSSSSRSSACTASA